MSRRNPLVVDVLHGLVAVPGPAHLAYFGYLSIQALVLLLWWPKGALAQALESQSGPNTLLAVIVALGATLSYYTLRAGAEEILLPGQHSLREWVLATPLSPARIVRGFLSGQLLQMLYATVLSAPLVLMAFSVAGGEWRALVWSFATVLIQATFYGLLGAVVYTRIGHISVLTFLSLRGALLLGYVAAPALYPAASHIVVSRHLLGDVTSTHDTVPDSLAFLLVYTVLSSGLVAMLYRLLSQQRRARDGLLATSGARQG